MRNRAFTLILFLILSITAALAQSAPSFPRFNFNAGGGYGIGRGDVGSFVGNSFFGTGGAGMNLSRIVGFDVEYMYYDMSIRRSVSLGQGLGVTGGSLNVVSLNGIIRAPAHVYKFRPYGIFGVGFYDRRNSSSTPFVDPGAVCQPSWVWWNVFCVNGVIPSPNPIYPKSGREPLGSVSRIAGGYNFGGGVTYPLNRWHNAKLYAEFRYHKAYTSDALTEVWPITVGLRW